MEKDQSQAKGAASDERVNGPGLGSEARIAVLDWWRSRAENLVLAIPFILLPRARGSGIVEQSAVELLGRRRRSDIFLRLKDME